MSRTLSCVLRGVVVASGASPESVHSISVFVEGQAPAGSVRLRTHDGAGELLFRIARLFRVVPDSTTHRCASYSIETRFYHYDILDREGNEIVVYHWEPEGISPIRALHLHLSAAAPIVLPQRSGSAIANRRTHLNRLHLLTGQISLEDLVEVLIREFEVVPLRSNWETVLADGR